MFLGLPELLAPGANTGAVLGDSATPASLLAHLDTSAYEAPPDRS
jgi:hypothetical protein